MLTGRAPMAHPPGSDTSAEPNRASSGPEHQDRGAHGLHQLIGREILLDGRGIHFDAHLLVDGHRHAHAAEQLDHGGDVLQMRHVRDGHGAVRQQAAGENRQGRVLRAGDADLALERDAALDLQLIHERPAPGSVVLLGRVHLQRERVDLVAHRRPERRVHQLDGAERRAVPRISRRSRPPRNARCPRSRPSAAARQDPAG